MLYEPAQQNTAEGYVEPVDFCLSEVLATTEGSPELRNLNFETGCKQTYPLLQTMSASDPSQTPLERQTGVDVLLRKHAEMQRCASQQGLKHHRALSVLAIVGTTVLVPGCITSFSMEPSIQRGS